MRQGAKAHLEPQMSHSNLIKFLIRVLVLKLGWSLVTAVNGFRAYSYIYIYFYFSLGLVTIQETDYLPPYTPYIRFGALIRIYLTFSNSSDMLNLDNFVLYKKGELSE